MAPPPSTTAASTAAVFTPEPPEPLPQILPETGAIEEISAVDAKSLAILVKRLAQLDYFQVLGLSHQASFSEIKRAFYRESRTYHPDRFFHIDAPDAKADIIAIYKRITEAYYFLRDDGKRKKYSADVVGPERQAKLRFTELSEVETKQQVKKEQEAQIGTHPKGRQFYAEASKAFANGRWSDAQRSIKMALTYEKDNPRYQEMRKDVEQKLLDESRNKGDQFKIK